MYGVKKIIAYSYQKLNVVVMHTIVISGREVVRRILRCRVRKFNFRFSLIFKTNVSQCKPIALLIGISRIRMVCIKSQASSNCFIKILGVAYLMSYHLF